MTTTTLTDTGLTIEQNEAIAKAILYLVHEAKGNPEMDKHISVLCNELDRLEALVVTLQKQLAERGK